VARAGQVRDARRVAGLEARAVRRRRVDVRADRVDARPALDERRVADHHREPAARRRVVVQQLTDRTRAYTWVDQ